MSYLQLLYSPHSQQTKLSWETLQSPQNCPEGHNASKIIINLCCKHINGQNQLYYLITHITRTPESRVFITKTFLLIHFLIYLIN